MTVLKPAPALPPGVTRLHEPTGLVLTVADGVDVASPLRLEIDGSVRLHVGEGSALTLVEVSTGPGAESSTELVLAEGARVRHVRLQAPGREAELTATLTVAQAAHSVYYVQTLALGGRRNRLDLAVTLAGEGAEAHLDGLAGALDGESAATVATVAHAAPGGRSRQLQKLLVGAGGHGEFLGRIRVERGAVGTDAAQASRGLLLDAGARIDARPELMIFADEVKCAHGAAIGALEPDALFYLQARGLSEQAARTLLVAAFADEVIARAPAALQAELSAAFTRYALGKELPCPL